MKFCSTCGSPRIELRVPDGDTHARHVCAECGHVHYLNPKVVVGCLPEWEHRILLCRRAIEPRYGLWTLPAGFLEIGESVVAGAARETLEDHFHYRNLDVSTLKELVRRWKPDLLKGVPKEGKHEALADVYESIAEMKHYRETFIRV